MKSPVILHRSFAAPEVELRTTGDGREIHGIAAPVNTPTTIVEGGLEFTEQFAPGSWKRTIQERSGKVQLFGLHDTAKKYPLGPILSLTETTRGLEIRARVSRTRAGDEALALLGDGALTGLSVGMSVVNDQWSPDRAVRTIREARLHEVSLVPQPAYDTARVLAVRSAQPAGPSIDLYRRRIELAARLHGVNL